MNKLLKARMKWGGAILLGLSVSVFTAGDRCDLRCISHLGLTKKLLSKTEAITSSFFDFFTNEQEPLKEHGTQNPGRKATSQEVG